MSVRTAAIGSSANFHNERPQPDDALMARTRREEPSHRPDPEVTADSMTLLLHRMKQIEEAVGEILGAINRPGPKTVIRMPEVERRTGLKKSAIYALIQRGAFAQPIKIGEVTGFVEAEVESWIDARIRERDQGAIGVDLGVGAE